MVTKGVDAIRRMTGKGMRVEDGTVFGVFGPHVALPNSDLATTELHKLVATEDPTLKNEMSGNWILVAYEWFASLESQVIADVDGVAEACQLYLEGNYSYRAMLAGCVATTETVQPTQAAAADGAYRGGLWQPLPSPLSIRSGQLTSSGIKCVRSFTPSAATLLRILFRGAVVPEGQGKLSEIVAG